VWVRRNVVSVQLVDWQLAVATGTRLVPPGPKVSLTDAVATVEDLRARAVVADRHVARITGLDTATGSASTVVVDRPDWIRANVESFKRVAEPLLDAVLERGGTRPTGVVAAVGSRAAGLEVGGLLGYLATRVLGQFELLGPPPSTVEASAADGIPAGRLTLVAPNIVATERLLDVDPGDFRLWVCLHEVTHRTQFASAPWLYGHVQALLREFVLASELDTAALLGRLRQAATGIVGAARGRGRVELSLVELMQTPEQRAVLDRLTGLMSLLEGHADVVMDAVGPDVVPSVARIRQRFDRRRNQAGSLERTIRRLLGVEMKMRQYAEGARFVRAVVEEIGMAGLNTVWTSADRLPTGAEIRDPQRWLDRVAGTPPAVSA
jgi:coenzyme F420 biosynthesis associated uncharacterized protein